MINDRDVTPENNWGNGSLNLDKVLRESFIVFFSTKLWSLIVLVFLFQVPVILWSLFSGNYQLDVGDPTVDVDWYEYLSILVSFFLLISLSEAAVVYGVFLSISGKKVSILECGLNSLSNFIPILVVGFFTLVLFYLGLVLLIVPGVYAAVLLTVVIPVIVVEKPGILESLKRSSELTRGSRWPLAGLFLFSVFVTGGFPLLIEYVISFFAGLISAHFLFIAAQLINSAALAYWFVVIAFTYLELRRLQEGPTKEQVASIFE